MKLFVALAGLALLTAASDADAKGKPSAAAKAAPAKPTKATSAKSGKGDKSAKTAKTKRADDDKHADAPRDKRAKQSSAGTRHAMASKANERKKLVEPKPRTRKSKKAKHRAPLADLGPTTGQSVGAPWYGRLQEPTQLPASERYIIRRPARAFGTKAAVALTKQVLDQILEDFPQAHMLAVGDMSSEHGGAISQHRSHQSGRDIDIGLFYTAKPASYPADFVGATEQNIDLSTTFALVDAFGDTASEDGGVQMMFLDYKLQGLLYEWAKEHLVEVEHLDKLFQYPRGKGATAVVRHEPNHDNHIHVRFKCPSTDPGCVY